MFNKEQQEIFDLCQIAFNTSEENPYNNDLPFFREASKSLFNSIISLLLLHEEKIKTVNNKEEFLKVIESLPKEDPARIQFMGFENLPPFAKSGVIMHFETTIGLCQKLLQSAYSNIKSKEQLEKLEK
ncbi:hypothetical protein CN957_15765 [Bacillus cereus]|nr:hypothetical protein CN957_15765 [Bacillus cereus]